MMRLGDDLVEAVSLTQVRTIQEKGEVLGKRGVLFGLVGFEEHCLYCSL